MNSRQTNPAKQPPNAPNSSPMSQNGEGETSEPLAQAPYVAHRRLQDPVQPSAAQEVLVDRTQPITPSAQPAQPSPAGAAWPFPGGDEAQQPGDAVRWLTRTSGEVGRYVAEQPLKAALLAVGAGALAALLLGRGMSRAQRGRRS